VTGDGLDEVVAEVTGMCALGLLRTALAAFESGDAVRAVLGVIVLAGELAGEALSAPEFKEMPR
jgi:hypothetical protein